MFLNYARLVFRFVIFSFILMLYSPVAYSAENNLKLILDWFINPNHAPIIIAQEKGFFEKAGLEVEIIAPADPSVPPKLVGAGEADLAISYQAQIHLDRRAGVPITRVGTLIATPLNCLLTRKEDGFKSLADLKGKKIGFSVAGVDEMLVETMLNHNGIDINDVEMVNVNWSLSPALMSKQVDGVIGAYRNFELTQMQMEGIEGKCFFIEEEGIPTHDELIYIAHESKMDKEKIARFLKATQEATSYIVNHPDESWEIFAATSSELDDALNKTAFKDTIARFALRPSALDISRYENYDQFLIENKSVEGKTDIRKMAIDIFQ